MTDFTQLQKTAEEMQEAFEKTTTEFQSKMQSMFTDMTKSFFEAAPEIKAVVWSQYTPYFNDGEECIFRINEINFLTKFDSNYLPTHVYDLSDDEIDEIKVFDISASQENLEHYKDCLNRYSDSSGYYKKKIEEIERALENPRHSELSKLCNGLSKLINDNSDLMKTIFGDHVIVTLTADGSDTNDCDHD